MTTATQPDAAPAYREVFVVDDDDTGQEDVYEFRCQPCGRNVDDEPCPDHAPLDVPGLRQVGCGEPGHRTWTVDRDDYGLPCPWCAWREADQRAADLRVRVDWHGRWRGTRAARWAARWAYRLGVISGYSTGTCDQPGHRWCIRKMSWRGRRPYALGWEAWKWRCLLRFRHWPGQEILSGYCGKCLPWPCCGSRTSGHEPECAEGVT